MKWKIFARCSEQFSSPSQAGRQAQEPLHSMPSEPASVFVVKNRASAYVLRRYETGPGCSEHSWHVLTSRTLSDAVWAAVRRDEVNREDLTTDEQTKMSFRVQQILVQWCSTVLQSGIPKLISITATAIQAKDKGVFGMTPLPTLLLLTNY